MLLALRTRNDFRSSEDMEDVCSQFSSHFRVFANFSSVSCCDIGAERRYTVVKSQMPFDEQTASLIR
jgi:hypothetical protein